MTKKTVDGGGLRYNKGKLRLDLVPPSLERAVAAVLQQACEREVNPYPERNWERGLPWSKVESSLMRHINKWRSGEDIDPETGLPHVWHLGCNIAFLIEFMETCPELDDRPRRKRHEPEGKVPRRVRKTRRPAKRRG